MNDSEKFTNLLNQNYFFKEFTFSNPKVFIDKIEVELADSIIKLDEICIIFQIKEKVNKNSKFENWFKESILNRGKNQIKSTIKYLKDIDTDLVNDTGENIKINNSDIDFKNLKSVILFYLNECKGKYFQFEKYYISEKGGFIHILNFEDYKFLCQYLISPRGIDNYLIFRKNFLTYNSLNSFILPERYILSHFLLNDKSIKLN